MKALWRQLGLGLLFLALGACTAARTDPPLSPNQAELAAGYNVQLGLAYLSQQEPARAKSKLLHALELAPHYPPALEAMAYFQEQTGNVALATEYYQQALAEAPGSGMVLNNYGAFLCRQGQYQAAIEYFQRAVNDPNYLPVAEAYENAGICALQLSELDTAKHFFTRAVQQDPQQANAWLALAEIEVAQHRFADAKIALTRYNQLVPNDPAAQRLARQMA